MMSKPPFRSLPGYNLGTYLPMGGHLSSISDPCWAWQLGMGREFGLCLREWAGMGLADPGVQAAQAPRFSGFWAARRPWASGGPGSSGCPGPTGCPKTRRRGHERPDRRGAETRNRSRIGKARWYAGTCRCRR